MACEDTSMNPSHSGNVLERGVLCPPEIASAAKSAPQRRTHPFVVNFLGNLIGWLAVLLIIAVLVILWRGLLLGLARLLGIH